MTLWEVSSGARAVIAGYDKTLEISVCERLADLGFSNGTDVECLRHAPFGGPHIFQIDNSIFALEKPVAQCVLVKQKASNE